VGDYTVDTPTYIQLEFVPSARYSSGGGYIEIICPDGYITLSSAIRCSTVFGLTGS
jgi:hypothetical protein